MTKAESRLQGDIQQCMARFTGNCRRAGLKVTPQRIAIYRALVESDEHPSAEMIWHRLRKVMPNLSLDTVNRTLLTFAETGMACVLEGSGEVRRYDGIVGNHQHFKCVKCKKVFDFHYKPYDDIKVPAGVPVLSGFEILKKSVYLEGLCRSCRAER